VCSSKLSLSDESVKVFALRVMEWWHFLAAVGYRLYIDFCIMWIKNTILRLKWRLYLWTIKHFRQWEFLGIFCWMGEFSTSKWEFPVAMDGATRRWKSLIVKLAVSNFHTSTCMTNRQTPHDSKMDASRGKHAFSHYVVLVVYFCYTLLINDCLVWSIVVKTKKLTQVKRARN